MRVASYLVLNNDLVADRNVYKTVKAAFEAAFELEADGGEVTVLKVLKNKNKKEVVQDGS